MEDLQVPTDLRFVNAHTHLELSGFDQPIMWNGCFTDWIAGVMAHRRSVSYVLNDAVKRGMDELAETGTVAVGDIVQDADSLRSCCGRNFLELIAWTPVSARNVLERAESLLVSGKVSGLSPHAPYTVCPELMEGAVSLSIKYRVPLAIHLAETKGELFLLEKRSGPIGEMMQKIDPDYFSAGNFLGTRPLDYLKILSRAYRALIVHGNYLEADEIKFLGDHRDTMSVVFCPVPHRYFQHDRYPVGLMQQYGVCVALGTDGRPSWPRGPLSMRTTLETLWNDYPEIDRQIAIRMATVNGAIAMDIHLPLSF